MVDIELRNNRDPAAAIKQLNDVVNANPEFLSARLVLAALYEQAGDHAGAQRSYRAVIQKDEANLVALNNLAYSLAPEKPDEALKLARQAVELAPDNPDVQDTLGWIYYQKGLYNSALGYLKAAFDKQPDPKRQYHLALCYLRMGNQEQASKNLLAALQKDPNLAKEEPGVGGRRPY